jgi:hypothetical protein
LYLARLKGMGEGEGEKEREGKGPELIPFSGIQSSHSCGNSINLLLT